MNNLLNVKEAIDGVNVDDFVLKNKFSTREIPKVTFNEDITVKGDVITQVRVCKMVYLLKTLLFLIETISRELASQPSLILS